MSERESESSTWRSKPWIAAVLSLLAPTSGLVYAGRVRLALLLTLCWIAHAFAAAVLAANAVLGPWIAFGTLVATYALISIASAVAAHRAPPGQGDWQSPGGVIIYIVAVFALGAGVRIVIEATIVAFYAAASTSMLPTLANGESFTVSKLRAPVCSDVVVYHVAMPYPMAGDQLYVKRAVAAGGDHVRIDDAGAVWVNGHRLDGPPCGSVPDVHRGAFSRPAPGRCVEERLGERTWRTWVADDRSMWEVIAKQRRLYLDVDIPPDTFYVLGDNRDASEDSRIRGFVPTSDVVGVVINTR